MIKKAYLIALSAAFSLFIFSSCAPMAAAGSYEPPAYEITPKAPSTAETLGVTLEVAYITDSEVLLIISNNTDYELIYDDGHNFSLLIDGRATGMGSGAMGRQSFSLPSGESRQISFGEHFWPGEFRLSKNIWINGQGHELYVEFLIEDDEIAYDMRDFIMDISMADPKGAVLYITNGLSDARIYFDRNYRLLQNINGSWQNMPDLTTRLFPDYEHFVSPRQSRRLIKNWGWLHGELLNGEYRLEKSFWRYTDSDERAEYNMYVEFRVDGTPPPHPYILFYNPFEGITTFRAEVTRNAGDNTGRRRIWNSPTLLVYSITPLEGEEQSRSPQREPTYIVDNDYLAVLDALGEPMLFTDIPRGAVVDITFSGVIFMSRPGILGGAILIEIVDDNSG